MSWDEEKDTFAERPDVPANQKITSAEWNEHVSDQKNHSSRHEETGSDSLGVFDLVGSLTGQGLERVGDSLQVLSSIWDGENITANVNNESVHTEELQNARWIFPSDDGDIQTVLNNEGAGADIAIASGTYTEALIEPLNAQTIVAAEGVEWDASGLSSYTRGVFEVTDVDDVTIKGVSAVGDTEASGTNLGNVVYSENTTGCEYADLYGRQVRNVLNIRKSSDIAFFRVTGKEIYDDIVDIAETDGVVFTTVKGTDSLESGGNRSVVEIEDGSTHVNGSGVTGKNYQRVLTVQSHDGFEMPSYVNVTGVHGDGVPGQSNGAIVNITDGAGVATGSLGEHIHISDVTGTVQGDLTAGDEAPQAILLGVGIDTGNESTLEHVSITDVNVEGGSSRAARVEVDDSGPGTLRGFKMTGEFDGSPCNSENIFLWNKSTFEGFEVDVKATDAGDHCVNVAGADEGVVRGTVRDAPDGGVVLAGASGVNVNVTSIGCRLGIWEQSNSDNNLIQGIVSSTENELAIFGGDGTVVGDTVTY